MSYKPVVSNGTDLDGVTTLVWGTGGALQSPLPPGPQDVTGFAGEGYYTVDSIDEAEDADAKYGTNGTGIKSWRMLLKHGKKWNVTIQDDRTMTPPAVATTVGVIDYLGDKTAAYTAKVISNDYRTGREQPGQRVIQVENLTLIDSQATT